jgi:hypothetical protein
MSKSVPVFIIFTTMLSLGGLFVSKQHTLTYAEHSLTHSENMRHELVDSLSYTKRENNLLREKVAVLQDSIETLHTIISELSEIIVEKERLIKALNQSLERKMHRYERSMAKIAALEAAKTPNRHKLDRAVQEKEQLQASIEALNEATNKAIDDKNKAAAEMIDYQVNKTEFERIADIVNNTSVVYHSISLQRLRYGRELAHISQNRGSWSYTIMSVGFDYDSGAKSLLNEKFLVKLVSKTTGRALAHIEANPAYPDKDQKGLYFRFNGNPVELTYINAQEKDSDSYEVQIYYVKDGDEYLMPKSVKDIVLKGVAVGF